MAAKRIIILATSHSETEVSVSGLFWIPITTGVRSTTSGSAWIASGTSAGASAAENTAIQNGTVLEVGWGFSFPAGVSNAAIQAFLAQAWTNANAQANGEGPNKFYGTFFDGTSWGAS